MIGEILQCRYKITKQLGQGGFGKTYLAEDNTLFNQLCVVKQFSPAATDPVTIDCARRLFNSEAQTLHNLGSHDQIPKLLSFFEENNGFFLVQTLIEGNVLSDELKVGFPWSELAVIELLENILEPLSFIHQRGTIHRDLKPDNLIRRISDRKIVLIDFGAVKQVSTQVVNTLGQAQSTIVIGTPGYMAPEQAMGNPTFSSDIYALGIIAIQALTGYLPQELNRDQYGAEIIWHHLAPQTNPHLRAILDRMVKYDFRQRYPNAQGVLINLRELKKIPLEPTQIVNRSLPEAKPTEIAPVPHPQYHPTYQPTVPNQSTPTTNQQNLWIWPIAVIATLMLGILLAANLFKRDPVMVNNQNNTQSDGNQNNKKQNDDQNRSSIRPKRVIQSPTTQDDNDVDSLDQIYPSNTFNTLNTEDAFTKCPNGSDLEMVGESEKFEFAVCGNNGNPLYYIGKAKTESKAGIELPWTNNGFWNGNVNYLPPGYGINSSNNLRVYEAGRMIVDQPALNIYRRS